MNKLRDLLPPFPKTPHLPFRPNAEDDDVVADKDAIEPIYNLNNQVHIEEKVDGANVGIAVVDEHPVIRNRDHILKKGFLRRKDDTTAKMQFRPLWNWYYDHRQMFEALYHRIGQATVYGEWMLAQHGMFYDSLPSYFIAYDVFTHDDQKYLPTSLARGVLQAVGFTVPPLLHVGVTPSCEVLENWCFEKSSYSSDQLREGLYFRAYDGNNIYRFKMIREGFKQGELWDHDELKKNCLLA